MADHSAIEWTNATWNPLVGCSRVSAGCQHCYAERHAYRFARQRGTVFEGTARLVNGKPTFTGRVNLNERVLDQPLRWREPRKVFVNSMSDLFHEEVPDTFIAAVFGIMAAAPQHTFQVLTKRPERMLAWFDWHSRQVRSRELEWERWRVCEDEANELVKNLPAIGCQASWPLPNVWLGVSVEDQAAADERIPLLLQTPAAVRFLSCEPLLGPIDLFKFIYRPVRAQEVIGDPVPEHELRTWFTREGVSNLGWVIAGGESGPGARPMHPDWARSLRDQCAAAGVPFFFKQWGEWAPDWEGAMTCSVCNETKFDSAVRRGGVDECSSCGRSTWVEADKPLDNLCRVGKKAAGHLLDGVEHHAFPQVPA